MDLKWQVAMISMRMKKFYKKTGSKLQFDAKEPVGFDKTKVECYNYHKTGHFARECRIKGNQDNRRRDAWNSGNKDGSRTRKKETLTAMSSESDTKREQLSDASIEIKAYSQGLKKVEAQLVAHQQGQLWVQMFLMNKESELEKQPLYDSGSPYHLSEIGNFHKKRMARKAELNNGWNNVQRVNKQNQFVPSAVLTRTGKIPVRTAEASAHTGNRPTLLAEFQDFNGGPVLLENKRQEKEANEEAEALRKEFAQDTENLVIQAGAAKASNTDERDYHFLIQQIQNKMIRNTPPEDIYQNSTEEVDINKKTENQAKMTKLSIEWKRLCKIKAKVQKCQSQSQNRRISSQTGAGTEEYY
ncbi:ribonuclease H-like domain-containing protein [Tanacetum coccineum]